MAPRVRPLTPGGDALRRTAGSDARQRRLLVGGLLAVMLLLAVATTTVVARHDRVDAAAPDARHLHTTDTTVAAATTTTAPTTTTAATVASTTEGTAAPATTRAPARVVAAQQTPAVQIEGDGAPSGPPPALEGDCGGFALRKADGSPWTCSFDDEFDGSSVDPSRWRIQETAWNGYHVGSECFVNSPNNVSVGDGALHLTVRREARGFRCASPSGSYNTPYTSGMLLTYGKWVQAFGRWEIRAKMPAVTVRGVQTSFWLWPQNPGKYGVYPNSGEIDVAEYYSLYPDRVVPYFHYTGSAYNTTNDYCRVKDPSGWHTYLLMWTSTYLSVTIDGRSCLYHPINPAFPMRAPAPFDQPFMLALTQGLGQRENGFDEATTPLPASTTVDYVRVWK
jgi:beta-glucanase (GH16 family)